MSNTARPKSSGDELSYQEVNNDLPVEMTSGEAIDCSSNPQAVYVNSSDGKVYNCNASSSREKVDNFIGFALDTASGADETITVQMKGTVDGFSGLTTGKSYYLNDTDGEVSTSTGSLLKRIGVATASDKIQMIREPRPQMAFYTAGHDLEANEAVAVESDGKIYVTRGDNYDQFVGFVAQNVNEGNTAGVILGPRVEGFSGLTLGATYYLDEESAVTDISQTSANTSPGDGWQSFHPTQDGGLKSVIINIYNIGTNADSSVNLWVYEGEGTGGTQIASESTTTNLTDGNNGATVNLSDPPYLISGNTYTVRFSIGGGPGNWRANNTDPYANGISSQGSGTDYYFEINLYNNWGDISTNAGGWSYKIGNAIKSDIIRLE